MTFRKFEYFGLRVMLEAYIGSVVDDFVAKSTIEVCRFLTACLFQVILDTKNNMKSLIKYRF